jgi:aminoglycoside phosphotransferase (APT) family kinase protein
MSASLIDEPQPVRAGEELDTSRLAKFLNARFPQLAGPLVVEQFPKGYSNLTYLVRAGEREMVLRRSPFGAKIKTAHDMGREYRILAHLITLYPKIPCPLAFCEDESVLDAPFYLMERVKGVILRSEAPSGLQLSPGRMQQLSENFIDNLIELHRIDYRAAGLGELGKPEGYVTRQIEGWIKRYQNARTDDIPEMDRAARWLAEHRPADSSGCLIHNDYKYDNLVLDPGDLSSIRACLDWEMATIGDPFMDLGSALGYWVDPNDPEEWRRHSFGVTTLPGNLNRAQLLERYSRHCGRELDQPVFYYVYGLFKIAVIVQQIYARHRQGLTRDERFGGLIDVVRVAGQMACLALEKGRISHLDA